MALPKRYERIKSVLARRQLDLTVLMEDLQKPHNLAAIVRTSDSVGLHRLHAVRLNQGAHDIGLSNFYSSGAKDWVDVQQHETLQSAVDVIKQTPQMQKPQIIAAHLSDQAVDYRDINYTQPTILLLGSEKFGVSEEAAQLADQHAIIPMLGFVESLNVSVAAALILYEAQQQRTQLGMYERGLQIDSEEYKKIMFESAHPTIRQYCIERNKPYPKMDIETGELLEDPRDLPRIKPRKNQT